MESPNTEQEEQWLSKHLMHNLREINLTKARLEEIISYLQSDLNQLGIDVGTTLSIFLFRTMESFYRQFIDIFSTLPEGYLPKWLLFTSALGIFNSIQNFCTDTLTKRVYANKPHEVTPLSGRLFATWTWSVSMIRIYAAFHLEHRFMYNLAIWTYVIALTHYAGELLVFKGCKLNGPFMSPLFVAVSSLFYLIQVKEEYIKFD